ncbi:SpoVG family protein [Butyrivibrio sp. AE3003]|uniref:SpoVG family protein n=1 Tax=Butyrivibrio sp. AE3003 TaxID=1496721 RepID=UPI00068D6356|nr:SpoVG family protein [Butyrivibrio sp. AE3003]
MKVSIKANKLEASSNNVRGLCTVTFEDCFAVRNISIVESRKGGTFVSMPSFKTKTVDEGGNTIFNDIAFPVTKEFREELFAKIKESYEAGEAVEFEWA